MTAKKHKGSGADTFIRIWQSSKSREEALRRTGFKNHNVLRTTAYRLIQLGVPLKALDYENKRRCGRKPADLKKLTEIAKAAVK